MLKNYLSPQAYEQYLADKADLLKHKYAPPQVSFSEFKSRFWRNYQNARHQVEIEKRLEQVAQYVLSGGKRGIGRLMVFMPPRHGKTEAISRMFPAWMLSTSPHLKIITASYGATLAYRNSRFIRNLIASDRYQSFTKGTVKLAEGSAAVDRWEIDRHEGGLVAVGVGGGITGHGGNVILVDDPVKSRQEAESEVYRERVKDWYTDDLLTRLEEPGGAIVIVQTRWHQDDLSGWLLSSSHDNWQVLNLPAFAEEHDSIGRAVGEALWPERYPVEVLRQREAELGPYSWAALYQQNPVPAEGGIFKRDWFEPRISQVPEITRSVRFWDLAMSEKTTADYTVGVKIGQATDGHTYILDVARKQLDWGDVTEFLATVMMKDGPETPQGIEKKGYMSRAVQALNLDPRLRNYQVWGYPKDKDKVTNALPFAAKCAAGVVHVINAHWTDAFIDELCSFNQGAHDDQVDAAAGAWEMIDTVDAVGEMYYADVPAVAKSRF